MLKQRKCTATSPDWVLKAKLQHSALTAKAMNAWSLDSLVLLVSSIIGSFMFHHRQGLHHHHHHYRHHRSHCSQRSHPPDGQKIEQSVLVIQLSPI